MSNTTRGLFAISCLGWLTAGISVERRLRKALAVSWLAQPNFLRY